MSGPRIAYICAEYPKVSHTFVMREVQALRRLGAVVHTFTVRKTPAEALLSEEDRAEATTTVSLLPADPRHLVVAHVRRFSHAPRAYLAALARALAMGGPGLRGKVWQLFYFAEAGLLADALLRRGVEHVHAHFVNVAASNALIAARMMPERTSWSFTMHGPLEFDDVTLHAIADKVGDADFVACISDFCRAQLLRLVDTSEWDKLLVVHCGVRPDDYRAREPVRSSSGSDPMRILSVGRLEAMKGFPVLIEALERLDAEGVPFELTLVGSGSEEAALRRRVDELGFSHVVRFTGSLPPSAIADLLAAADVFCLPSFAEGVPVVLMEAMAAACPVVATRVMGVPELVTDGLTGLVVSPARADELAAALAELARDPEKRRAMGLAGRKVVREHYDVDREARSLLDAFEIAVSGGTWDRVRS